MRAREQASDCRLPSHSAFLHVSSTRVLPRSAFRPFSLSASLWAWPQVEAQRIFHEIDRNHSMSVSRDEFHRKLQLDNELETLINWGATRSEQHKSTEEMEAILASVDRDGDGEITWDEFWNAVRFKSGIFATNNAGVMINFSAAVVPQTA